MINKMIKQKGFQKRAYLLFMLFCVFTLSVSAQDITVSGTVSDTNGPLPGVSVVVNGTTNGTATDFDGNYVLSNVASDATLTLSYIGYVTQEVAVSGTTVNVTMEEDLEQLDEVVVIGYGTQSRAEVTGAIATVDSDELAAIPVVNAEQALQGRASGVTVINSGSPGSSPLVKIRGLGTTGNSDPLYVIDGVISGSLGDLNANDIESINILKDASTTAIYGSRGSNGVVMVTTKKGRANQKAEISFSTYVGTQYTNQRYDVLNTEQYLQYANDAFGVVPTSAFSSSGLNTNWQDEIFQTGLMQNYDLSVSGGGENSRFRISGAYLNQEGIIIETGAERYSFRANSDFTVGKFRIGENLGISFNSRSPEVGAGGGGRSLIEHAIKAAPYFPVYNADNLGGFQGPSSSLDGQDSENPVRIQELGERINKSVAINGSIYGEVEIIDGLKFKSQVGLEYFSYNNNSFRPSFDDDSEGSATHSSAFAAITKNTGTGQRIILTNSLNYETTISDVHNFDLLVLAEDTSSKRTNINASSQNPISDEVNQLSNEQSALSSGSPETNILSYLGRLNYNYDGKYIFAASLRRDASSRFGSNFRWATFPSVALGWNIAAEDFLADSEISNLKLRASWGVVGNQNIGDYQYSSTLTSNFFYPVNGNAATGTTANGLANPNLKWEETTMTNIGLDFGFLNNKISGSIEYYNNTSDDLLLQRTTPVSLGFHQPFVSENVGSVETKGFELDLNYYDSEGDFTWSAGLNLGTSTNELLSLGGSLEELTSAGFEGNNITRSIVGEPLFQFFGLVSDGIYQNQAEVDAVFSADPGQTTVAPGDIRFKDLDGDGAITSADRTFIGNPYPKLTYGLNLTGNYKEWDFNVFFSGVSGNDLFNTNIYDLQGMPRNFNAGVEVLNRWTTEGQVTNVPRAGGAPQNVAISDRYVEDGSYTRLKNLSIGYTFSGDNLSNYFSKLRLYVSGQNLLTISDYSGLDPEVGNFVNNGAAQTGIDRGNYPQPQSFLIGAQLKF